MGSDSSEELVKEKSDKQLFIFFKQKNIIFINDPVTIDHFFIDRDDIGGLIIRGVFKR